MPLKVSQVTGYTRTVSIHLPGEGEPLEISYCPAKRNRTLRDDMQALIREAESKEKAGEPTAFGEGDAAAFVIERLATSWNVVDDQGKPVPITADFLTLVFGYPACISIHRAIVDDMDSVGNRSSGGE